MSFYDKILEKVKNMNCIHKERGAIFVLTALLLPIMFGCLGIAYDVGTLYMHKARLQNVADAAALAGGRAYIQSQTKPNENDRDNVDGTMDYRSKDIADCAYKNGRSMTVKYEYGTQTTINRGSTTKHPNADAAADKYIYNNIVNLDNTVYADKYSHFAVNYGNATSKVFYRIGLYETVPLRFLPVITDKYSETVRAGAIAFVEPGTTTTDPGSGGSTTTITHTSVFDNLFTFSESLFTRNNIDSNGNIYQSFFGDMVYTHQNGLLDGDLNNSIYFESSTPGPAGDDDPTNTNHNHWYEQMGSSSTVPINDPIIDTTFDTKAYLEAFRQKLDSPHIDANQSNQLKASDINNPNSTLYTQELKLDGKSVRKSGDVLYLQDGNEYYAVDQATNNYMYVQDGASQYKVNYVRPQNANYTCKCVKIDDKYYLLNVNGQRSNCYVSNEFNNQQLVIDIAGDGKHPIKYENNVWLYGINDGYGNFNTWQPLDSQQLLNSSYPDSFLQTVFDPNNNPKYLAKITAGDDVNVFHATKKRIDDQTNQTFDIIMDEPLTGNENIPIYVIIDDIYQVHIEGNASTTRRPVILVFLGEGTQQIKYEFTGGEFKGVIYAPVSGFEHVQNLTGKFRGNIITKRINIEASSSMTWVQENFLENTSYTDEAIKAISDENKQKVEAANAALTDEIKNKIRERLGITEEQQNSKDWFEKLRYPEKQSLYTKWKALYEEYKNDPAIRNILWPWNEHFNIESGSGGTVTTPESLRLINFRTEYRENGDPDAVVDPFIYMTLGNPLAY